MIFEKTLANGLELIVKRTEAPVAAMQVWVDVGSIDESAPEAGYCHFLEHMLFKGTDRRTTAQIAGSVEGAGGEMNAFTSFEYTVYHITLSNQRWQLANEILADMVLRSTFKPAEFSPEKEVILEEIKRGEDSPDRQLYQGAYSALYGTTGYGVPVIGFPSTVKKCTAGGLRAFWKRWYSPQLMTVVICGDVDPVEAAKQVEKHWGWARGRAPRGRRRTVGHKQRIATPKTLMQSRTFPVKSIHWVGSLPGCALNDDILPALDVGAMVLGQGESSRLYRRLFREEECVTSAGAGIWAPAGTGMLSFDAETSIEKAGLFRKPMIEEIERFLAEGPTADELERAKTVIETERVYTSQSMDGLANRLGFLGTSTGNIRYDLEYMALARELTSEDVREAARAFIDTAAIREFALFPKDFEPARFWPSGVAKKAPAKKPMAKPATEIERMSLSNGIELVLFPRRDTPVVSMQACALGGLRVEDDQNSGVGRLLSDVWEKGPEGWTAEKFAEHLESKGSRIDSFSGRNSLGLGCTTLTRHIDDIAPLFIETLFSPALDAAEFRRAQTVALEDIRTSDDDLGRLVGRMFCENLFEGHPYSRAILGSKPSVSQLTIESLRAHYSKWFSPAPVVVAVSGKFKPAALISAFEKVKRGAIGQRAPQTLPWTPPKAPRVAEVKKNREQSHLIMGYLGTRILDDDRFDLKILLTLLGGQSGRLFTELRDKGGLCYTVAPMAFEGMEPGYFGVYMGCDPRKRADALAGIQRELEKLTTQPIRPAEIKRAKEFLLGRQHMDMQLNSAIVGASAFNTLYGLGHDEHLRLGKGLEKVTSASLKKLAVRMFASPAVTALVV